MNTPEISSEKLIAMFETLVKIRRFEEKAWELYDKNLIPGTIHLYLGQEAVAAGVCANLRRDDYIVSTHRGHGHCIAKGAQLPKMMAELLGKYTGYCKGKGGSMHVSDAEVGNLGATAVVGAGLPLAVGAAYGIKLKKSDQVAAAFFGDGATNQGTFNESLNIAAAWKLPVLFVCENNIYAMGTRISSVSPREDIAPKASGYGVPAVTVDGNNVVDVYSASRTAVERARRGEGPTFLECKTYRQRGHSRYDPGKYRPPGELEEWMKRDPVMQCRVMLIEKGWLTDEEATQIESRVTQAIEEAAKFAIESPHPPLEEALRDVYAEE